MKIALLLPGISNSGGVRVTARLAQGLLEKGHDIRILYRLPSIRQRFRTFRRRLTSAPSGPRWFDQFSGPSIGFDDLRNCQFDREELILAVGMAMSAEIRNISHLPNPKLQYFHGSNEWSPDLVRLALPQLIPKIGVASCLRNLARQYGQDLLAVVPNGIDLDDYYPDCVDSLRNGVGTVYASDPPKDPMTIRRFATRFVAARPDVPLRIFSFEPRPREFAYASYFRNPSLEVARGIYSHSQVWVLASSSEGFGMPILEAMACGCVVVSTDCGGPCDLIVHGKNGFLVNVGDDQALQERVSWLLDHPKERQNMQVCALTTAKQFTWTICIQKLEFVLDEVVQAWHRVTGTTQYHLPERERVR